MKNFQHKNRYKRIMHSKPILVILAILLLFFIWNIITLTNKTIETKRNKDIAVNKIIELKKQKEDLELKIQKLNTDKGLEENIREKFGLGKEGEGMIVIVDDQNKPLPEESKKQNGFFSFFKNLFN